VLWDNTTRVAFTLAAAALGLVAVYLSPGRKQIEERNIGNYDRSGRYAVFVLAFLVMGIAGVLAWEVFRYHNKDLWVGGNMLVLAILGIGIFGVNLWTLRLVKRANEQVSVVEAMVVELSQGDVTQPGLPDADLPAQPMAPAPVKFEMPANMVEPPKPANGADAPKE
jgi:hypothetical protein